MMMMMNNNNILILIKLTTSTGIDECADELLFDILFQAETGGGAEIKPLACYVLLAITYR